MPNFLALASPRVATSVGNQCTMLRLGFSHASSSSTSILMVPARTEAFQKGQLRGSRRSRSCSLSGLSIPPSSTEMMRGFGAAELLSKGRSCRTAQSRESYRVVNGGVKALACILAAFESHEASGHEEDVDWSLFA